MNSQAHSRRTVVFFVIPILFLAGGFAAGWLFHPNPPRRGPAPLPVLGQAPDYTLTNQLGQTVSSASFRGKVQVVTFLFTYCRGYCPLVAHNFMTLERQLKLSGMADEVQLVAFNVDPQNTGPAEMKAFQEQYGWKPDNRRWEFLTGSSNDIHRVVTDGFHVYYKKVVDTDDADGNATEGDVIPEPVVVNKLADKAGVDYDIVHNDLLEIVDTRGRIRKIFTDADRVSDDQMMAVIERLLLDQKNAAQ